MSLLLIDKVKTNQNAFAQKVVNLANELGTDPNYLMAAMDVESSLNEKAVNTITGATGLIQFMPSTANALGTSTAELKNMSNLQQLDFVRLYFLPFKGKLHNLSDVYLSIFYPVAAGKDSYTFSQKVMAQNPTFAKFLINGQLTKDSIENYLKNRFPSLIQTIKNNSGLVAGVALVFFFVAILLYNSK